MSDPDEDRGKKLVFIGDAGVGKTCLITRFTQGIFDEKTPATIGASFATKIIEIPELNQSLTLDVWDTAGQEKYKSLTRIFFQGAKMAILVYDITRRESFYNMKNSWYREIKENGDSDIVLGIAGNKSDLYDNEEVPEEEAREFAKSIDAVFGYTSAQSDSGIKELFKDLGKKYLIANSSTIDSDEQNQMQKPELKSKQEKQEESKQNIKIASKDVVKKNVEQKKKKSFC